MCVGGGGGLEREISSRPHPPTLITSVIAARQSSAGRFVGMSLGAEQHKKRGSSEPKDECSGGLDGFSLLPVDSRPFGNNMRDLYLQRVNNYPAKSLQQVVL